MSFIDLAPSVRIAAADALAQHGGPAELARALPALRECADPARTGAYAGIAAMNVIDELGERAAPLLEFVRDMPTVDPRALERGNDYIHRLKDRVLARFGEPTPEPKK